MDNGKGDGASTEKGTMDSVQGGQWMEEWGTVKGTMDSGKGENGVETGTVQRRRKDGQWTMETGKRDGTASTGICNRG